MGKNKKNKNVSQSGHTASTGGNQGGKPVIIVKPANEILTTEEGEKLLNASIDDVTKYCNEQREAADRYYDEKKAAADSLEEKKQEEISREVERAVKEKEREMKDSIEDAKKEAKRIRTDAEKESEEKLAGLAERQKELDGRYEEYTKQVAALESSKLTYKQEMLDDIKTEMVKLAEEREKLESENEQLKKEIRKQTSIIKGLEDDNSYYEEQLSENTVKRTDILSYKAQIAQAEANYAKLESLYKEQQERLSLLNAQILLYGDDPQKALKDNAELEKQNRELKDQIANCPSAEELTKLREVSLKYEEVLNKLDIANAERTRLESENNDLKVSKDEIESYRRFIKILELQKAELQRELDRSIELYNSKTEKIFASLSLIDKKPCDDYPSILSKITLKQLCDRFRRYLASRADTPLYYEEKTIRTFIAGFASSRLMILEGLSGTGKSSLPRAFQDFLGAKTIEIPVQSSWKDRNDLLGFYNDFKKQYKETEFLKALYQATHDQNNIYVIVLDEMNLSRIEYYFADLLSVLEKPNVDDWKIELVSDYASISQTPGAWPELIHEGKLQIGDNTWFVGTANKDDSTFIITDKVYDRSVVISFDKKGEKEKSETSLPIKLSNDDFQKLLNAAKKFKDPNDDVRFHDMIDFLDRQVKDMFQITFGNRISNQLETFVPVYIECGGTVSEAVDIMFSRKILRKLEGLYDEDTKEKLEALSEEIKRQFQMPITVAAIQKMIDRI